MKQMKLKADIAHATVLTAVGKVLSEGWDAEMCRNYIISIRDDQELVIDPNLLGDSQLNRLGFKQFKDTNLLLIPLWFHPFLPVEFKGGSIFDGPCADLPRTISSAHMVLDDRGGMMSYGIVVDEFND